MAYFKNIHSLAELKKEYRRLALENHPDKGGSTEVMQQINVEFERLHEIWKNDTTVSANASGYENDYAGASYHVSHKSNHCNLVCLIMFKHQLIISICISIILHVIIYPCSLV